MIRWLVGWGVVLALAANSAGQPAGRGLGNGRLTGGVVSSQRTLTVYGPDGGATFALGRTYGWPYGCGCAPVPPASFIIYQPLYVPVPVLLNDPSFNLVSNPPQQPIAPPLPPPPRREPEAGRAGPKPRDALERQAEAKRLLRRGDDAFADGRYQDALNWYQQATGVDPMEATAYFHLAQSYLAVNKPGEAGVAIVRGLRLHPNWPNAPFQPRALYGNQAGNFDLHLGKLAEQVGAHPNDESLLFLLAYELWFDHRRDDARLLFEQASALAADPTLIRRFLEANR